MKRFLFLVLMLPCAIFAADIEGTYDLTGHDPYTKQNYTGTATIKQDANNVYQITWKFNDNSQYKGTALLTGNELSAVFNDANPSNANHIGLQYYIITDRGLDGSWVLLDKNLVGTEKLTKK